MAASAAATAFAQLNLTGIGDPAASAGSQYSGTGSQVTTATLAELWDGDGDMSGDGATLGDAAGETAGVGEGAGEQAVRNKVATRSNRRIPGS